MRFRVNITLTELIWGEFVASYTSFLTHAHIESIVAKGQECGIRPIANSLVSKNMINLGFFTHKAIILHKSVS